jgi:hypothetical protein
MLAVFRPFLSKLVLSISQSGMHQIPLGSGIFFHPFELLLQGQQDGRLWGYYSICKRELFHCYPSVGHCGELHLKGSDVVLMDAFELIP